MTRTIALSYARLSGVRNDPLSPHLQIKRNLEAIARLGALTDSRRYTEGGDAYIDDAKGHHSARTRVNLPAWDALYERAKSDDQVLYAVAFDMSRAFRSVSAMLECADALLEIGVKLYLTRGGLIDVSTADGRRDAINAANAAEYESRKTSERISEHNTALKADGVYVYHRSMYGLKRIDGDGDERTATWEPTADLPNLIRFLELYAKGACGWNTICRQMFQAGITWINHRNERSAPQPKTLRNLVERIDFYAPFLSPTLIERVKFIAAERKNHQANGRAPVAHAPPLLARALYCPCGKRYYVAGWNFKKKRAAQPTYHAAYDHRDTQCQVRPRYYPAERINALFLRRLEAVDFTPTQRATWIAQVHPLQQPAPVISPRTNEVEITELAKLYAKGKLTLEQFQTRLDALKSPLLAPLPALPRVMSPERLAKTLAELPLLIHALVAGTTLTPIEANRTVRDLFQVYLYKGEITSIVLRGTEGIVSL